MDDRVRLDKLNCSIFNPVCPSKTFFRLSGMAAKENLGGEGEDE